MFLAGFMVKCWGVVRCWHSLPAGFPEQVSPAFCSRFSLMPLAPATSVLTGADWGTVSLAGTRTREKCSEKVGGRMDGKKFPSIACGGETAGVAVKGARLAARTPAAVCGRHEAGCEVNFAGWCVPPGSFKHALHECSPTRSRTGLGVWVVHSSRSVPS